MSELRIKLWAQRYSHIFLQFMPQITEPHCELAVLLLTGGVVSKSGRDSAFILPMAMAPNPAAHSR